MKLNGEKLKEIRQKRGLSQTALSEGICTQATISLMEKQNRIPKMNILTALCARLAVDVNVLIEDDHVSMTSLFDQISIDIVNEDYISAEKALKKIKVKKLETEFDKQRYYYLLGTYQVQTGKFDEAIFNYELILTQFSTMSANIYWVMTTIGMALAYEKRGNDSRALKFVQRAVNLIDKRKITGGKKEWLIIYRNITKLYISLDHPQDAIKSAERGIKMCRENETLFMLANYYYLLGIAFENKGDADKANKNFSVSHGVAVAADDRVILKKLNHK